MDPQLSPHVRQLQEAQAAQVLLEVSVQLRLAGPQLPVSGVAIGGAGARGRGLPMQRGASQLGELSGDGLLGAVVLPGQAWKHKGHQGQSFKTPLQMAWNPLEHAHPENGENVTQA